MALCEGESPQVSLFPVVSTCAYIRPYLLRRGMNESHFVYSQSAVIDSAKADLLARRAFVVENGTTTSSGGYRL